jgi:hypothetical protein
LRIFLHASICGRIEHTLSITNYRFAEDQRLMPKGSAWPVAGIDVIRRSAR